MISCKSFDSWKRLDHLLSFATVNFLFCGSIIWERFFGLDRFHDLSTRHMLFNDMNDRKVLYCVKWVTDNGLRKRARFMHCFETVLNQNWNIGVIKFLSSRRLAFLGSQLNGNFLRKIEVLIKFDSILESHISTYGRKR